MRPASVPATDVDGELARFFALAHRHFDDVAAAAPIAPAGVVEHGYALAGHTFHVRYATESVAALLDPAIHHLRLAPQPEVAPAAPDAGGEPSGAGLTVRAWADERRRSPLPLPPWEAVGFVERGNARMAGTARWMLAYDRRPGLFSALDGHGGDGLYWAHDAAQLEELERARPFRRLVSTWLHGTGVFTVHAAAVGTADGGALICGRSGSGKSTTAIACVGSVLGYLGDDIVLVEPGRAGGPTLHSVYSSAKLNRDVLAWRPELAERVVNADRLDREKALVQVGVSWPDAVVRSAPLRVLVVPRLSQQRSSTSRAISPNAAFKAMVPDTLFTTMGPAGDVIAAIGALVRTVPAVEITLGHDIDAIPGVLADVIDSAA